MEAILFPAEVERLMVMAATHRDDVEQWPSVWLCEECGALTKGLFEQWAELPPAALTAITSELLAATCRAIVAAGP